MHDGDPKRNKSLYNVSNSKTIEMELMFCIVMITSPPDKAEEIARVILEKRVAACVNISQVSSLYWWNDKIDSDNESLLIVKTRVDSLDALKASVLEVHPYDVPEIIALPIITGSREYLDWVDKETTG